MRSNNVYFVSIFFPLRYIVKKRSCLPLKKGESSQQCSPNSLHRLVGCPPFWHRRQVVMLRSIMEGRYHFHSPEWDDISAPAKNLVSTWAQEVKVEHKWENFKLEEFLLVTNGTINRRAGDGAYQ